MRILSCKPHGFVVADSNYSCQGDCFLVDCLYLFGMWSNRFWQFVRILVTDGQFVVELIHQLFAASQTLLITLLSLFHQQLSFLFVDRRNIVTHRYKRLRLQLFLELVDDLIFCDSLDRFFDLEKRMFMLYFLLTGAAEIEIVTENALIANAKNAKVILTFRANDTMDEQFFLAGRILPFKVHVTKYFCSGSFDKLLLAWLFFSRLLSFWLYICMDNFFFLGTKLFIRFISWNKELWRFYFKSVNNSFSLFS